MFWESHNPTQLNRQGNDQGTQYRSGIYYYTEEQKHQATVSKQEYEKLLQAKGYGKIETEIKEQTEFYYAEDYHQQYLHKNPDGYCGLGGTGVSCPIGLFKDKKGDGKSELWYFPIVPSVYLPSSVYWYMLWTLPRCLYWYTF